MRICIPVASDGTVGHGWGRARAVALADVEDGAVGAWQVHEVGWDALHGQGAEGAHHARIVRFLREQQVDVVVAEHMGPGMQRVTSSMGLPVVLGAAGDAREAVLSAYGMVRASRGEPDPEP